MSWGSCRGGVGWFWIPARSPASRAPAAAPAGLTPRAVRAGEQHSRCSLAPSPGPAETPLAKAALGPAPSVARYFPNLLTLWSLRLALPQRVSVEDTHTRGRTGPWGGTGHQLFLPDCGTESCSQGLLCCLCVRQTQSFMQQGKWRREQMYFYLLSLPSSGAGPELSDLELIKCETPAR